MGLFGKKDKWKSSSEMTDKELVDKINGPMRDILTHSRYIKEAADRDLVDPKKGKPYKDYLK